MEALRDALRESVKIVAFHDSDGNRVNERCVKCGVVFKAGQNIVHGHLPHCPTAKLNDALNRIGRAQAALEQIIIVDGIDAGVILLSAESTMKFSEAHGCEVYQNEFFSPLGDGLINLYRLLTGGE